MLRSRIKRAVLMTLLQRTSASTSVMVDVRPYVLGKHIYLQDEKLYVRGVTYGTFRPDENGDEFHDLKIVERDLAQMAARYTCAARWFLDIAQHYGLRVM